MTLKDSCECLCSASVSRCALTAALGRCDRGFAGLLQCSSSFIIIWGDEETLQPH